MKAPRRIHVEVEPLSDARWHKLDAAIERALDAEPHAASSGRVETPPPPPRGRAETAFFLAAGGVLAAAAVLALVMRSRAVPPAEATSTRPSPPHEYVGPLMPAHVETGAKRSFVALGTASMDVGPESAVTATGDDAHGFVLVLEHGSVECDVAPRAGRPPFVVQSGDVRVRVVGTRFLVRRDVGHTAVAVTHGTVEVAHDGITTMLHDGERWDGEPAPVWTASSAEAPPEAPSAARATRPAPPGPTDQQLYEEAARLEARDPDAAIATYQKLATKNGPWRANALFAAGRLAAERKQSTRARALLEDYLRHYPAGANAEDARSLLAGLR